MEFEERLESSERNGNTGRDAGEPGSPNYAETPNARGFGHIAFNVDDVYAATS